MRRPRFDVMSLQIDTLLPAVPAGESVTLEHGAAPFVVGPAAATPVILFSSMLEITCPTAVLAESQRHTRRASLKDRAAVQAVTRYHRWAGGFVAIGRAVFPAASRDVGPNGPKLITTVSADTSDLRNANGVAARVRAVLRSAKSGTRGLDVERCTAVLADQSDSHLTDRLHASRFVKADEWVLHRVAFLTERYGVREIKAQFRKLGPWLDVVNVKVASRATLLAREAISRQCCFPPLVVHMALAIPAVFLNSSSVPAFRRAVLTCPMNGSTRDCHEHLAAVLAFKGDLGSCSGALACVRAVLSCTVSNFRGLLSECRATVQAHTINSRPFGRTEAFLRAVLPRSSGDLRRSLLKLPLAIRARSVYSIASTCVPTCSRTVITIASCKSGVGNEELRFARFASAADLIARPLKSIRTFPRAAFTTAFAYFRRIGGEWLAALLTGTLKGHLRLLTRVEGDTPPAVDAARGLFACPNYIPLKPFRDARSWGDRSRFCRQHGLIAA